MDCAQNWVLRLVIHDYSLESQSTLNVKEVVFICVLQQHGRLTELAILLSNLTLLLPALGWLPAGLVAPGGCFGRPGWHWQKAAEAVSFRRGKLWTKASLVTSSMWCCFPNPVEKKGEPMTTAKQTCSSSPVHWMWNRVTQIWMETIANISQQGLWKKHLAGPLIREFN